MALPFWAHLRQGARVLSVGPFYFGCWGHNTGHTLRDADGSVHRDIVLPQALRFTRLDAGYCDPTCSQAQGRALLHHVAGWTVLALWDRTVDTRFGSNSAFLVEGTHGFAEVCDQARAAFPLVWQRLHKVAGVLLADMLVGDQLTGCPEAVEAWLKEHPGWRVQSLDVSASLMSAMENKLPRTLGLLSLLRGIPIERNAHLVPGHMRARVVQVPSTQDVIKDVEQLGKLGG